MTRKLIERGGFSRRVRASLPELSSTPAAPPVQPGAPARLVVELRCAVNDRASSIWFRANMLKAGTWFVERISTAIPAASESTGDGERQLRIPIDQLPFNGLKCPHCGHDAGPVLCGGGCRQLVCRGRVKGNFFQCSCGASGFFGEETLTHVTGQSSFALRKSSSPQLGAPNVKLIGR